MKQEDEFRSSCSGRSRRGGSLGSRLSSEGARKQEMEYVLKVAVTAAAEGSDIGAGRREGGIKNKS